MESASGLRRQACHDPLIMFAPGGEAGLQSAWRVPDIAGPILSPKLHLWDSQNQMSPWFELPEDEFPGLA